MMNEVLKRDILPNLTDDMAKEQTVAILSLLKNLDANTVQNEEPFKQVNSLLLKELKELLNKLIQVSFNPKIQAFCEEFSSINKLEQAERSRWETLNRLFSTIIQFIYQNSEYHSYIPEVRKIIRQQLEIERKTVF